MVGTAFESRARHRPGASSAGRAGRRVFRAAGVLVVLAATLAHPLSAQAAANLTIRPITWNVIGLDSNRPADGPNTFAVGARVCNTGGDPATNVASTFVWDSANGNINLTGPAALSTPALAAGACSDFYYNVAVNRVAAAYDTTRRFHITATADGLGVISTPTPRELYVEHLVSQNRNSVTAITGPGGVGDPPATTVEVGQTYTYKLFSSTAPGGYEQLSSFLNFPNVIFQVISVAQTYTAPPGGTNDTIYADACGWQNDPTVPATYRTCVGPANYAGGKAGGNVVTTYTVKILSAGTATIAALIYDFSGSSYHYNGDYGRGINTVTITAVEPTANLSITKSDSPDPVVAGNQLTYTIQVQNAGPSAAANVTLTDVVPAGTSFVSARNGGTESGGTVTWSLGGLAVGASQSVTMTVAVAPGRLANLSNTATVSSATVDPAPANNSATQATTVSTSADLSIAKGDAPDPVVAGDQLTYTLQVSNAGPSVARNVTVSDPLPAGTTFVSADNGGAESGGTVTWSLGDLAPGDSVSLELAVGVVPGRSTPVSNVASVSSTTGDPAPANNAITQGTSVDASADLSIAKADGADPVTPGDRLTYTLDVTNTGQSTAQNVTVIDPVPAGTTFVSADNGGTLSGGAVTWSLGSIPPGATVTLTLVVDVNLGTTTSLSNSASVSSTTPDPDGSNNDETEATSVVPLTDLRLSKADAPDPVAVGDDLTYTVTIDNDGPSGATGVVLTDALPVGVSFVSVAPSQGSCSVAGSVVTCAIGDIASGGTATIDVVVTPGAVAVGSVGNTAQVTGDETDPDPTNNDASTSTTVTAAVDVRVQKTDNPDPVTVGESLTYTVVVTNDGPSSATGVELTDDLPASVTFVSATPTQGTCSEAGGTVTCPLGGLVVGGTATVVIVVTPTVAGQVVNQADVSSAEADTAPANNDDSQTTTVDASADLRITKSDSADPVVTGAPLVYTLTITNQGPSDATGVEVEDVLPASVTFGSTSPSQGSCSETGGTVTCSLGNLAPGDSATVDVLVTPTSSGTIVNSASVSANEPDPAGGNTDDEVTTVDPAPPGTDLRVTKTDSSDPVAVGDPFTYTVVVANDGPQNATGVVLTDTLPATVTFASATPSQGSCAESGGTVTCLLGGILAGGSATVAIDVTTDAGSQGTVVNVADVAGNEVDLDPANNSVAETTDVTAVADVRVQKSDAPDPVTVAQDLTYTLVVRNDGPSAATNVVLTDDLPASVAFVSATPTQGTCAIAGTTLTCPLGVLAVGGSATVAVVVTPTVEGLISNTADVAATEFDPAPGNNDVVQATTVTASADIRVTKVDAADPVAVGEPLAYTITVDNDGPSDATGVDVVDVLPATVAFVSASASQGSCSIAAQTVRCAIGGIASGGSETVTIVVVPSVAGPLVNGAQASAAQPDPGPANNDDSEDTTITTSADLRLSKSDGIATMVAGSSTTYTITVTNDGPSAVPAGVVVTDPIPAGTTGTESEPDCGIAGGVLTCTTSSPLAPGESVFYQLTVEVPAAYAGAQVVNTAEIDATPVADPDPSNDTAIDTNTVSASADVRLAKSDAPDPVAVGDPLTYTLTATNDGPSIATDVQVVDTLPGSVSFASAVPSQGTCGQAGGVVTCDLGAMAPGWSATATIVVTPNAAGAITNDAVVSATEVDPAPGNNDADQTTTVTASADVRLMKVDDADPVAVGDPLTYTLVATNDGPSDATNAQVVDALPASVAFVTAVPSQGSCAEAGGTVTCDLGAIAAAASASVDITVTPTVDGTIQNDAVVSATEGDPFPGNNDASETTTATTSADLRLSKDDGVGSVAPGASTDYTITLTNDGPSAVPPGVVVVDQIPAGTTASESEADCVLAGATVTCTTSALLAAGDSVSYVVTVDVPVAFAGAQITNDVAITASPVSDADAGNDDASDTDAVVPSADVSLTKSDAPDPVTAGDQIAYTLTAGNAGPSDATGVQVVDTLPGSVTFVSAAPSQGTCAEAGGTVTCDLGAIPAGGSATIDIVVTADVDASAVNVAVVTANEADPVPSNNDATTTTTIDPAADVRISKSASPDPVAVGDPLTYSLVVTNDGPSDATGVQVVDALPGSMSFVSATPSQGTCSHTAGTVTCDLGALATGASASIPLVVTPDATGTISNSATVSAAEADPAPANNTAAVDVEVEEPAPTRADLSISKTVDDGSASEGDRVRYTIEVTGLGPGTATGIVVVDVLPETLAFVEATASQGTYEADTGRWSVGTVARDATATLDLVARIREGAAGRTIVNVARIQASDQTDHRPANDEDDATLDVLGRIVAPGGSTAFTGSDPRRALLAAALLLIAGLASIAASARLAPRRTG